MYNILITDDEDIVLQSLSFIISKSFPDEFNILRAQVGMEAIEICKTVPIDFIFMDINMPGLNGLDSISEIKKILPNAIIIILSAFDKFQYAQTAVELGVYRYITKPFSKDTIIQILRGAMLLYQESNEKNLEALNVKEQLNLVSPIVENDFIYTAVFSDSQNKDLNFYLDYLKINPIEYFFLCIEIPVTLSSERTTVYNQIKDIILSKTKCVSGQSIMNRVIYFIPFETDEEVAEKEKTVNEIFKALAFKIGRSIKLGVGNNHSSLDESVKGYQEALQSLNNCPETGGVVFSGEFEMQKPVILDEKEFKTITKNLTGRILSGDTENVTKLIEPWIANETKSCSDLNIIKTHCFTLLSQVYNEANIAMDSRTFELLEKCINISEVKFLFTKKILFICDYIETQNKNKSNPTIKRTLDYINANLEKEISLVSAADFAKVKPVYLSRLFKEETGKNFIEYLTDMRLDKAKQLLADDELNIKEITYSVGYADQNYFSKIFRKKFGMTPTEFRKSKE